MSNASTTVQWVASQLPKHPNHTCMELFRLYIEKFASIGMERGLACASLKKEFQRLEDSGMVLGVKGNKATDPTKWTWVGPDPEPNTVTIGPTISFQPGKIVIADDDQSRPAAVVGYFDLPEDRMSGASSAQSSDAAILDADDPLDCVLIEIRRQFKSRNRVIENAEYKRDVLARISTMLAPDIADVLSEIIEDLA
jgi:hypothetical protein